MMTARPMDSFWFNHETLRRRTCRVVVGQQVAWLAPAAVADDRMALQPLTARAVQQDHAAAVRFGGSSEGAPGLRPRYQPDFYAAYVRDPDGHKLAAVCRGFTARENP